MDPIHSSQADSPYAVMARRLLMELEDLTEERCALENPMGSGITFWKIIGKAWENGAGYPSRVIKHDVNGKSPN